MSATSVKKLDLALGALAAQDVPGKLAMRLEAAIDAETDRALRELARDLAGSRDPRMFRSKAARLLIRKGAEAMLAERSERA